MTKNQVLEVSKISSGTIANILGSNSYKEIDKFIEWLFSKVFKNDDIIIGNIVDYGENSLIALKNAAAVYHRHHKRF